MTDQQALQKYAVSRDAEAFRILVERYQRLVYSAVSRRLRREEDIEDIVQLTFLKLATSAATIRRDLAAWLYVTALNAAKDLIRRDQTRQRHESAAALQHPMLQDVTAEEWEKLSLLIDESILELPGSDRLLIVEHFFRGRTQRDLAQQLGISQPTVMRRTNAAIEMLRTRLSNHALSIAGPALAAALEKLTLPTVPAAVTAALAKVGLSGVPAAAASTGATSRWPKFAFAATILVVAAMGGIALLSYPRAPAPPPLAAVPATAPAPPLPEWRSAFYAAYALAPGQNLRFIPPPPLPQRQRYLHETEHNDSPMPFIQWRWVNAKIERQWMEANGPTGAGLNSVLSTCAGIDGYHVAIDSIPAIDADGDWIVRDGASTAVILKDLQRILLDHFKIAVRVSKIETVKDAFIVTGRYQLHPIPGCDPHELQFFTDVIDHPLPGQRMAGGGAFPPDELWTMVGGYLGMPVVDQSTGEPQNINWALSWSFLNAHAEAKRKQALAGITAQTGLAFKREKHTFVTWKLAPSDSSSKPAGGD